MVTPRILQILSLVLVMALLNGCAALVMGGAAATGMAVHDRRSFGTVVDDRVLRFQVGDALYADELFDTRVRIKTDAYNGWVLLAGEVLDETRVERAGEIVEGLTGTRRVINELAAEPKASFGQRNHDLWVSSKVKAGITDIDLPDFDASRVKVTTTRGIVYLMGWVTETEAEAVTERVRTIGGVERVVTAFEYIDSPGSADDQARSG